MCDGVLVSLLSGGSYDTLLTQSAAQTKLLKVCLGGSDGNTADNVEVYNWDYGTVNNPHLIRLIDATQDNDQLTTTAQTRDPSLYVYPVSTLCDSSSSYIPSLGSGKQFSYSLNTSLIN